MTNLINGYGLDDAQTRLTWELWSPPRTLPPIEELRARIGTPDRRELLALLDRTGIAGASVALELGRDLPDPGGFRIVYVAGQRTRDPHDVATGCRDDLHIHAVVGVLSRVVGPVGGDPVDRDHSAVQDQVGVPVGFGCRSAERSFGARAASRSTVSPT